MASSTYDELLRQVESLRAENSHLKRELQDNSSHLTVLEGEATTMLTNLQTSMDADDSAAADMTSCYPEFQTPPRRLPRDDNDLDLDQNSNSSSSYDETNTEQTWAHLQTSNPFRGSNPKLNVKNRSDEDKTGDLDTNRSSRVRGSNQDVYGLLQELDQERSTLLSEIEAEDKHCKWYYEQIEAINEKIGALPQSQSFNSQADIQRRQLDYEAQRLRKLLQDNLGSAEQIARRRDARMQRVHAIEREMLIMQQRHCQGDQDKRDSGTCDLQNEDGVIVTDAATNTLVSGDAFITNPEADSQAERHGVLINGPNGTNLVTIATQTAAERAAQSDARAVPSSFYHGGWALPPSADPVSETDVLQQDTASVMSFRSSNVSSSLASQASFSQGHHLGTKVEMVYSLLSMLGTHDKDDMSRTLLAMSSSQDSCIAMRQSGCLPLLIQLLHGSDKDDKDAGLLGNTRGSKAARARAAAALHNIVHSHPDDKRGRREARVLRLLEQIRAHCDQLRCMLASDDNGSEGSRSRPNSGADIDHHPGPAIAALMKLSFDEEHRHAICTLGGLQAIAELLQLDHETNGTTQEQYNITMRRYACMALTNLTFGDGTNKALLCSMKSCMAALVAQLQSPNEDLRQVAASVLRNLSWRADLASKKTLREVHSVTALMEAAMQVKKESTLKSILSALWNLSAHCSENKADICAVNGALGFQVDILTYKSPSKTLAIIENGGGILRNVSSHIAVCTEYRVILRERGCLSILLKHLRSPSLTIVSNACGTLWNLSARCPEDQKALWDMGAVNMLRNLVHSKHKMISMGSAAALKNLLSARPALNTLEENIFSKSNMPGLHARKAKALKEELDSQHLTETCENLESPHGSPTESRKQKKCFFAEDFEDPRRASESMDSRSRDSPVSHSSSQDSLRGAQSLDSARLHPLLMRSKLLQERQTFDPRSPLARSNVSSDSGPNSRIIQAMQEVALHAGLDSDNRDPFFSEQNARANRSKSSGIPTFRGHSQSAVASAAQNLHGYSSAVNSEAVNNKDLSMNFSHLSQRMENLHLNMPGVEQDEPINYSIKYSEATQSSTHSEPVASGSVKSAPNTQLSTSASSAFAKPVTKLQNYVGGVQTYGDPKTVSQASKKNGKRSNSKENNRQQKKDQFVAPYPITDLDNEQPTNYGIRFAEHAEEDGEGVTEQPINYSTRFTEPEEGSSRAYAPEETLNDDTVRTFCTEGTPLNFMSTATSINDLTSAKMHKQHFAPVPEDILNLSTKADSEMVSSAGSQSTDRNTGSTVILRKTNEPSFKGSSPQAEQSTTSSHPPSLYSYNDNSTHTSSPSEKARQYCTEGTPTCFSRASSLSSLHSCDADATTATSSPQTSSSRQDGPLQSIDENDSLNLTNNDVTLKADADIPSSANTTLNSTGGNGKTVTFDENHQVQETPLMFSRCSSLGSLSSFDAHSVHSSVVSEYSRRESEVVSPSDLPASPSESMPTSPTRRKSPVKFGPGPSSEPPSEIKSEDKTRETLVKPRPIAPELFEDSPQHFADEGSPMANFSCATSLSALTIDDDFPKINKEVSLRRLPLGKEEGEATSASSNEQSMAEKSQMNDTFDETVIEAQKFVAALDDDDDDFSVSEGEESMLAECISLAMPMPTKSSRKVKKGPEAKLTGQTDDDKLLQSVISTPAAIRPHVSTSGYDTPMKFATEDTPLNFSTAGSLSDLSLESHKAGDGASVPDQSDHQFFKDDASDLSSLSVGEEAIDASMLKNKKQFMDRVAEGADSKPKQQIPQFKKPQSMQRHEHERHGACGDSTTTYAVEGTPVNFSRRTSLSDISVESVPVTSREPVQLSKAPPTKAKSLSGHQCYDAAADSPKVFGMEGTPVSFSRNDSLSSLSCDEEDPVKTKLFSPKKPDLPAVARLKTPTSKKQGPTTSTPVHRSKVEHAPHAHEDQLKSYAVEDTPCCHSRTSSLSSLNSDDHKEAKEVEEAAANFSRNSSLSSLSVESLSFDPIPSEEALLAQCISAAMPKIKKKQKKEAPLVRASPSGSSGATHPSSREDDADSLSILKFIKYEKLKNKMGPVHR